MVVDVGSLLSVRCSLFVGRWWSRVVCLFVYTCLFMIVVRCSLLVVGCLVCAACW